MSAAAAWGAWAQALRLLRRPATQWPALPLSAPGAGWRFTLPLMLVGVLAATLGFSLVGLRSGDFSTRFLPMAALREAVGAALLALVFALLLAESALRWAPRFGGQSSRTALVSAALYALGPLWLWSQTLLWPLLWWAWPLALAAVVWQVHAGLRQAAQPSDSRALAYTATSVITAAAVLLLLASLARCSGLPAAPTVPPFPWSAPPEWSDAAASAARSGTGAVARPDESGQGGPGERVGLVPPDGAGSGAMTLPPGTAASATADLERWVRSGQPTEPLTRTVLQDLLPGPIDGFDRRITESYAHAPGASDAMRQVLTTGAMARVENVARQDRSRYLHLTIEDLGGHGSALAAKLLSEIASGSGLQGDERTQRSMSADDSSISRLECDLPTRECKLEVLVGERYHVRAESGQLPADELRRYVARVDLGALAARAKAKRPIE
ncbi:hypothetical protein [Ideonella alba]|uniref:Yip1 domain-containing protein n=1 Tax=Ideonella alba TaxID=2824118 RepID=A0A941BDW6_9BURK|nr:hypothetical protein [Ideonella alba]MBQ0929342.1 hypothetical protein [Ideonella alba]